MKYLFYSILISFLFVGCIPSYSFSNKTKKEYRGDYIKVKAFVTNKDLKQEYEILKASKIYELVNDSSYQVKIKLYPIIEDSINPKCGNPMAGSMLTFGLLPSYFYDNYKYKFDRIKNENIDAQEFDIEMRQSLWLFNMFYPKSFKNQFAKGLLVSYQEKNK